MTPNDNACCQRQVDPEADKIFVASQLKNPSNAAHEAQKYSDN
jgi:hypothetical protein